MRLRRPPAPRACATWSQAPADSHQPSATAILPLELVSCAVCVRASAARGTFRPLMYRPARTCVWRHRPSDRHPPVRSLKQPLTIQSNERRGRQSDSKLSETAQTNDFPQICVVPMGTGYTGEDVGELVLVPGQTERRGVLGLALQVTCGCPAVGHRVLASAGVYVCPPAVATDATYR